MCDLVTPKCFFPIEKPQYDPPVPKTSGITLIRISPRPKTVRKLRENVNDLTKKGRHEGKSAKKDHRKTLETREVKNEGKKKNEPGEGGLRRFQSSQLSLLHSLLDTITLACAQPAESVKFLDLI